MNLIDQLKRDEGLRLKAYPDPLTGDKPWTIGYGHTGGVKKGDVITEEQALLFLLEDITKHKNEVIRELPWANELDEARFCVLVNMCFNLGIKGLLTFSRTLAAVEKGRYKDAAIYMLDSKWAEQVKGRANRLAKQMETGEWQ